MDTRSGLELLLLCYDIIIKSQIEMEKITLEKPVFVVNVKLDECIDVEGDKEQVKFLRFHGTSESDFFCGEILQGGVDCQIKTDNEPLRLSARYVMEGNDCTGKKCRVFIENDGVMNSDDMRTVPKIVTDSEILSDLTQGKMYGEISGKENGEVEIRIYRESVSFDREELWIEQGNKRIYGELYRSDKGGEKQPIMIMSHGFNGSSEAMRYEAECMAKQGIAVYCYDFCGGGLDSKSTGKTTTMTIPSEQEDLKIVVESIKKFEWVDISKIFLFGGSQGGFVTALTAPEIEGIAGVFLEFPAFCIPDDWEKIKEDSDKEIIECMGVPLGKCFADTLPDYDVFERAAGYTGPVILFHGTDDSLVDISYSERLCKAYKNARLFKFPGQEHGFTEPFISVMAGVIRQNITVE